MQLKDTFSKQLDKWKESILLNLSRPEAGLQPAALGLLVGLVTGCVIVLFRFLLDFSQSWLLPETEKFEHIHWLVRFCLPIAASLFIAIIFSALSAKNTTVGVIHVMERLNNFQGHLPIKAFALQFISAVISILGGHSVGREGPSIHLGATSGSFLGEKMKVPDNTLRILVGSGCSAAIAASFNTPLAGVIFAMEVVLMEFTISSFIPVILASVCATSISIAVFGNTPALSIPAFTLSSLLELPFVVILGLLTGMTATGFIKITALTVNKTKNWSFTTRIMLAGLIIGFCSLGFPEVMGMGYDTMNATMLGQFTFASLLGILIAKIIATTASIGLGVPAGVIGPTLFIGTLLGASVGYISINAFPDITSNIGVYSLIGLGAMMAATLQAPLAALMAMLELTNNSEIIFPAMLAIVIAELTRSEIFNQPSIFKTLLHSRGLDFSTNPMTQHLRRIGVASVMDNRVITLEDTIERSKLGSLLQKDPGPKWILLGSHAEPTVAIPAVEIAHYLNETEHSETVELDKIPVQRRSISGVHQLSTLHEAKTKLQTEGVDLLYIYDTPAPTLRRIKAILTKEIIESSYKL